MRSHVVYVCGNKKHGFERVYSDSDHNDDAFVVPWTKVPISSRLLSFTVAKLGSNAASTCSHIILPSCHCHKA